MTKEQTGDESIEIPNQTDDLYAIPGFYQRLKEMEDRLEDKTREFQLEEINANIFASQFVIR